MPNYQRKQELEKELGTLQEVKNCQIYYITSKETGEGFWKIELDTPDLFAAMYYQPNGFLLATRDRNKVKWGKQVARVKADWQLVLKVLAKYKIHCDTKQFENLALFIKEQVGKPWENPGLEERRRYVKRLDL